MKNLIIVLLLFVASSLSAQPGPFGVDVFVSFRDEDSKSINIHDSRFQISWVTSTRVLIDPYTWGSVADTLLYIGQSDSLKYIKAIREKVICNNDTLFGVQVLKTPVGGGISPGSHYLIVKNDTDTMRLYPPVSGGSDATLLDNILFTKGNFEIPYLTYILHSALKPDKRKLFKPNLNDDFYLFEVNNASNIFKKIYAECIEPIHSADIMQNMKFGCSEDDDSKGFYNEYFDDKCYYLPMVRLAFTGLNVFNAPVWYKRVDGGIEKLEPEYNKLGIFRSGIFILQRERDGVYEYGQIEVPIDLKGLNRRDSTGDIRYRNFDNIANLNIKNVAPSKEAVLGYYAGIKQYDESFGTVKDMWGLFKLHISASAEEIKRIGVVHAEQNNLFMDEHKSKSMYKYKYIIEPDF